MLYTSPIFDQITDDSGSKFIDCDFRSKEINEKRFSLACSPEMAPKGTYAPILEDRADFDIIPKSEWSDRIEEMDNSGGGLERFIIWTYDQGSEGTCTSNQESQKGNVIDGLQYGIDNVVIRSPISIYMEVAPGPRTGSSVGGNLVQHRTVGALPITMDRNRDIMGEFWEERHSMTATGYSKSKYKSEWEDTAKYIRIDEFYEIATSGGFVTALFNGWPVGYGRQSHSILALRPVMKNGVVYVIYINSWGVWGFSINDRKAYGLDSPSQYGTGASRYGCNCVCSTVVPPWMTVGDENK